MLVKTTYGTFKICKVSEYTYAEFFNNHFEWDKLTMQDDEGA
jgi:hypothetical protein